ncbi:MAG: hypothetical protein AAF984_01490 [Verrucomicrobiota bacterium]
MSLKLFHIVFVTITTLASLFLGAWSAWQYSSLKEGVYLAGAIGGGIFAVICVCYGFVFYQKLKGKNLW